jgi:choline kinase
MCGGRYEKWSTPRHLTPIYGEPLVARTIRQLREHGIDNIAISSDNKVFEQFGVPVLHHQNSYVAKGYDDFSGYWCDAFYPTDEPVCYIFGDVIFTDAAIKKIVNTETDSIQFFASAPPFVDEYKKTSAEPFALKVVNTDILKTSIAKLKQLNEWHCFRRKPIMWELWQVIKQTPINIIDYTNYVIINDSTCDIDEPEDVK